MSEEALAALRRIQHIHNPIPDSIFANDLATIRAALEESGRDAERYRYLRAQPMKAGWQMVTLELMDENEDGPTGVWYSYDKDELDAAIDAARAAEGG